jgi:hypothetical protein
MLHGMGNRRGLNDADFVGGDFGYFVNAALHGARPLLVCETGLCANLKGRVNYFWRCLQNNLRHAILRHHERDSNAKINAGKPRL